MKAWQCRHFSGPVQDNLYLSESVPKPVPSDTEVLVEVHSTTINPIDYKILELGLLSKAIFRSPVTPGVDVCGRVVQVGSKVSQFKIGDLVYGSCDGVFGQGALAQYVQVSEDKLASAPAGLEIEGLAAIATVGLTSLQALRPYIKRGDRVFINGGSGGTGVVAIQIAKELGCHVTTSCSSANVELGKGLGADEVLDYKKDDIIEQLNQQDQPFNLIVDNVGSPANLYRASRGYLAPSGTFVQVGLGMDLKALRQVVGNMVLPGFLGGGQGKYVLAVTKPTGADLVQLAQWMEQGKLRAIIDSSYEFLDAPKAFARIKTGRARGKVVVSIKDT